MEVSNVRISTYEWKRNGKKVFAVCYIFNVDDKTAEKLSKLLKNKGKNGKKEIKKMFNLEDEIYMWGIEGNTVTVICHN